MNQRATGIYPKFTVRRNDGRDQPGGDRAGADYFVLDQTFDPYAIPALLAYADVCADKFYKEGPQDFVDGWNACREAMLDAAPQPAQQLPSVIEEISQQWDGCIYDDDNIDIGETIRAASKRLMREQQEGGE